MNQLFKIVKNKGISFERGESTSFKKNNYYQVINAYKNLFADQFESIDDIKNNIINSVKLDEYRSVYNLATVTDDRLYDGVCSKICTKYGLEAKNQPEKEFKIKEMLFFRHVYMPNTKYSDFVRMYNFEHELRLLLLKYVLIVEENVKNIFISYLNDKGSPANYLINIENYNTTPIIKNRAFSTFKKIIDKHNNYKSKPIKRKRDQKLTIPYWIIINELTMNETYNTILNLKETDSKEILIRCMNFFTKTNVTSEKRGKSINQLKKEESLVQTFSFMLSFLGEFRNKLAHNEPIYNFNIKSVSIFSGLSLEYDYPIIKKEIIDSRTGVPLTELEQQHNINEKTMNNLEVFFGTDDYNRRRARVRGNYVKRDQNLNLSFVIYLISKIIFKINSKNDFQFELKNIYRKYNIVLTLEEYEITNINQFVELKEYANSILDPDVGEIIQKIESGYGFKLRLKKLERDQKIQNKKIINLVNKIKVNKVTSNYGRFPVIERYTSFTGIDKDYFEKIKN